MTMPEPSQPRSFVHRMLRALAIVGVLDGLFGLASTCLNLNEGRLLWSDSFFSSGPFMYSLYSASLYAMAGVSVFEIVCFVALFQSRSWSRVGLITWCLLSLPVSLARHLSTMLILRQLPSLAWGDILPAVVTIVHSWVFPLFTLWMMRQREVAALCRRGSSGGFEVVPMARVTDDSPPQASDHLPL